MKVCQKVSMLFNVYHKNVFNKKKHVIVKLQLDQQFGENIEIELAI